MNRKTPFTTAALRGLFCCLIAAVLAACAGGTPADLRAAADKGESPTALVADRLVEVAPGQRPLRLCLLADIAIELMTDRVRLSDPAKAEESLGRLLKLQGMVATAQGGDPLWTNTTMADASFVFAAVLTDYGEERIADYVKSGLSVQTFVGGARRLAIQTVKGAAMLRDIDDMFAGLEDGRYTADQLWAACSERAEHNRAILLALTGARAL